MRPVHRDRVPQCHVERVPQGQGLLVVVGRVLVQVGLGMIPHVEEDKVLVVGHGSALQNHILLGLPALDCLSFVGRRLLPVLLVRGGCSGPVGSVAVAVLGGGAAPYAFVVISDQLHRPLVPLSVDLGQRGEQQIFVNLRKKKIAKRRNVNILRKLKQIILEFITFNKLNPENEYTTVFFLVK